MNSKEKSPDDQRGIVRLLPDLVINQISAGEVVDRPSSVVRELVENSIDAGARSISVYLEDGGSGLIRVIDDGCGMTASDAERAFLRHATSKIRNTEDLTAISTLGFRGEALPSIASVARVRLRTQHTEGGQGTEIVIAGGVKESSRACTIKGGSDIEVRSLFYNTPARKKFMRTPRTEEAKVKTWLRHSAVAHPQIHYRYYSEGREIFNLPPRRSSIDRARELFQGATIVLQEKIEHFQIEGLVSHPSLAEGDSSSFILLINGRLVSDRMLARSVRDGFDSTLKSHEYPVGFLSLTIAPHLVDVNVHPQKAEVRFVSPQSVFTLVRSVVRHAVMRFSESLPQNTLTVRPSIRQETYSRPEPLQLVRQESLYSPTPAQPIPERVSAGKKLPLRELRFIGQAFRCYLFAEAGGQLFVVDMHAAHERIIFNKIRREREKHQLQTEKLLIPQEIVLSEYQTARVLEYNEQLLAHGFEIGEENGKLVVRHIPSCLAGTNLEKLFQELSELPEDAISDGVLTERIDHLMARKACHASIRSGRELEREEVYALFEQMDQEELANACPHGRPVVITFTQAEIEQWFGRDR